MIKPEALTDERLWDAEAACGLPLYRAFTGLWMYADREGRFEWRPRPLKAVILPYWQGEFGDVMDALVKHGFVQRYEIEGRVYGLVINFLKHQRPNNREEQSTLPPPVNDACLTRASRVPDPSVTRASRVPHASTTREIDSGTPLDPARGDRIVSDRIVSEGKGSESGAPAPRRREVSPPSRVPSARDPLVPAADHPGVTELHAAWKDSCGYPSHKFRGAFDNDAGILADAIRAYGLDDCLAVARFAPNDGMVSGKRDEHGRKHDTIRYIFGNTDAFNRILRAAKEREGTQQRKRSAAEVVAEAKLL